MNYTVEYDTNEPEFRENYEQWMDDYPLDLPSLIAFSTDRFITNERINELDMTGAKLEVTASENGIVIYKNKALVN